MLVFELCIVASIGTVVDAHFVVFASVYIKKNVLNNRTMRFFFSDFLYLEKGLEY